ncbi:protease SohB [Escherichia fergusonii]|uniref:Inner membrane peptidase n=1 Tax=Escherichia fergusonii (strain ATCC 35469 / DSM 13698 / CCUG 18766 / IAM 14443 / JCM 21226 / LMG 7866 / NBRC 102419 / NCTC 12128 / CDC 0568-73) TaxID=585054 RepID=B7LS09_ESCF3|nr:protease SohB [Escherichia fergusonii]EGO8188438.1 protease SohB [Escherichia fergusonii]EHJ4099175.1 protease SohB [Escherichia fergusonii]EIH2134898.1 protease SohB [Escherichia fergusonii]EIH2154443.1 protease SohB [Escherichia fergusonii]EIH9409954.1 protease SohB [Escherichia fergusonii]
MELLSEYGLFLAKIVTVVLAIAAIAAIIVNVAQKNKRQRGELRITRLSEQYEEMKEELATALMDAHQQKIWHKAQKKKHKQEAKLAKAKAKQGETLSSDKPRVWVLDFKGSMDAHEVTALREEITAVLAVYKPQDQVVVRLESPGGVVHGYGLAASQLQRLRDHNIPLTVTVDKVAASGGYMMACVADKIVSAPFAIVGSIGVVAQLPNFNRFLKSKDIDIELHTAGQYKRTLTLLGENTEEGREKFREELNETHLLFKDFVKRMRPSLDIDQVATGEHWYGQQALEKGLVDEINTSDDVILGLMDGREVVNVRYMQRKKLLDRFTGSAAESADRLLLRWWQRGQKPLM